MGESRNWYLVCYDIRDPERWRPAYRLLQGYGQRIQYSIFRCKLSAKDVEQLRWELTQLLSKEDSLLIIGICDACVKRIGAINRPEEWTSDEDRFLSF